jgi:hypothetical protein
MAMDCRAVSIRFVPTQGQARREVGTVVFNGAVSRAEASIMGISIGYDNGEQHVLREMVTLDIDKIDHNVVTVGCNFLARHDSGNIDDPFDGRVDVLVVADVAHPVFRRRARGDAGNW